MRNLLVMKRYLNFVIANLAMTDKVNIKLEQFLAGNKTERPAL